jgi:D-alanyl-D-alanine carboxypeptidase
MAELMDLGFDKSRNRVREQPPVAPDPDAALVASAEPQIDEIDEEGGAGKTIRVSGEVKTSPRPKARPTVADVPAEVAIAMAEGIEGALAEANTPPAPAGTLDFQADAIAAGEAPAEPAPETTALAALDEPDTDAAVAAALAAPADAAPNTEPAAIALAADDPAPLPPGSLEAQAAALATGAPVEEVAGETALAVLPVADESGLADLKPVPRPETLAVAATEPAIAADALQPETVELPVELAAAEPAPELVVTDSGLETDTLPLGEVSAVETVSAAAVAPVEVAQPAMLAASVAPIRRAPIFDTVEVAAAPEEAMEEAQEVVVMSTSGGRHFGVIVGDYPSRYEAERALLKTALAESATLHESLRKPTQADGAWRASFMGLTEDQAELACRRLRARAVPCETVGG